MSKRVRDEVTDRGFLPQRRGNKPKAPSPSARTLNTSEDRVKFIFLIAAIRSNMS